MAHGGPVAKATVISLQGPSWGRLGLGTLSACREGARSLLQGSPPKCPADRVHAGKCPPTERLTRISSEAGPGFFVLAIGFEPWSACEAPVARLNRAGSLTVALEAPVMIRSRWTSFLFSALLATCALVATGCDPRAADDCQTCMQMGGT